MPHILLTNDDGIHAEGVRVLAGAFAGFADVSIVAPSREQSGTAQALTLRQPIICNQVGERDRHRHRAEIKRAGAAFARPAARPRTRHDAADGIAQLGHTARRQREGLSAPCRPGN